MYKLSIGAIAKNEQYGLREWIAYHRAVGVEHFYIYDNDSTVPVRKTLQDDLPYGMITLIEFPGLSKQMPAYQHCLKNFGPDNEWIAFIDCDEFLVPKKCDSVPEVLRSYQDQVGLVVNWVIFGSDGHRTRPSGLVIENYVKGSPSDYVENLHVKSIVQPKCTLRTGGNPHCFTYQGGRFAVTEKHEAVTNAWSATHSTELLQLNHYTTKSLEDFEMKISKGRADAAHLPTRKVEDIEEIDSHCTVESADILRFAQKTKDYLL